MTGNAVGCLKCRQCIHPSAPQKLCTKHEFEKWHILSLSALAYRRELHHTQHNKKHIRMLHILCNSMAIVVPKLHLQLTTCAITVSFFVKHKADFVQSLVQCYIFKNGVTVFPWSSTCPNARDPPAQYQQRRIDVTLCPLRHRHRSLHRCPGCFESLCAFALDLQ